ncbi:uncharacterized protein LOC130636697 [Hydractinia symbiolongicarpus]|uniref:uncharacterized protein LOC130635491 n=1 Tax=Hydractinia symbiolongicarpus TaxID=13093 RepID=UPI00254DC91B|nr:uncharacterized protein LOC130635491 [Hydractinia symbiolongicarpus]XP_057302499.1 uncharacterized protein LOC130636697 [Hydractinia symbiolongicarpus]
MAKFNLISFLGATVLGISAVFFIVAVSTRYWIIGDTQIDMEKFVDAYIEKRILMEANLTTTMTITTPGTITPEIKTVDATTAEATATEATTTKATSTEATTTEAATTETTTIEATTTEITSTEATTTEAANAETTTSESMTSSSTSTEAPTTTYTTAILEKVTNQSFMGNYSVFNYSGITMKTNSYFGLKSLLLEFELNVQPEYAFDFSYDDYDDMTTTMSQYSDFKDLKKDLGGMYGCLTSAAVFTAFAAFLWFFKVCIETKWTKILLFNIVIVCLLAVIFAVIGLSLLPRTLSTVKTLSGTMYEDAMKKSVFHGNPFEDAKFSYSIDYSFYLGIVGVVLLAIGAIVSVVDLLLYVPEHKKQ